MIDRAPKSVVAYEVLAHLRKSEKQFYQEEMEAAMERVEFLYEMREISGGD